MTITAPPLAASESAPASAFESDSPAGFESEPGDVPAAPPKQPPPAASATVLVASSALTILAAVLLGFVAQLVLLSDVEHFRSQRVSYANFRSELALGTAPVSALNSKGKPLAMGSAMAVIEIPLLGIREVVGQGTTSHVLMDGPGHRRDSVFPGQAGTSVIMGRSSAYGAPFGKLASLRPGDRITVTTGQGVQKFGVLDVRRAGDRLPVAPADGESRLVLITATGAAYVPGGVLRVDAKLLGTVQPAGIVGLSQAQLPSDEKPLSGEPDAWLPIVLWSQVLLAAAIAFVWGRIRWGRWQAWLVGTPVLAALGLMVAESIIRLLPNLL
jgi:sortase A